MYNDIRKILNVLEGVGEAIEQYWDAIENLISKLRKNYG